MTTRKGLKKVHINFDTIYRKLDSAYQRYPDNERIRGGVVGIYSKMSVDSLLRNKLIERGTKATRQSKVCDSHIKCSGLIDKLIPLLDEPSTRYMALRALTTVTSHGGADIRSKIALHSEALCKLVDACPDEHLLCDLVISILSHCVGAVVGGPESSPDHPDVLRKLNMPRILKIAVYCITQPFSCAACVGHGTDLIATATLHAPAAYKVVPDATKILVAGLRSGDWSTRAICFGSLLRLHKQGSEDDTPQLDPQVLISSMRSMTGELQDVMMDYGLNHCDVYSTLSATRDFQQAIMKYPQNLDLYSLGKDLYKIIIATEFSIADGYFETINERTGRREVLNFPGMQFQRYPDALPLCAKAIRDKGRPEEQDMANVLDIKFKVMRQRVREAADQAQKAIDRNPNFGYYYYAVSLAADHITGLRASKKGMKCTKGISPFVKFQLMQRAVEHAAEMGMQKLQNMDPTEEGWEVGVAFLTSALQDAKQFLAEAPPDARYKKNVAYWFILLTIVLNETVSLDLREIQVSSKSLIYLPRVVLTHATASSGTPSDCR